MKLLSFTLLLLCVGCATDSSIPMFTKFPASTAEHPFPQRAVLTIEGGSMTNNSEAGWLEMKRAARKRAIPPFPPMLPGMVFKTDFTRQGDGGQGLAIPPQPVCLACPKMINVTASFDDFGHPVIGFQVTNLLSLHSYTVQNSSDLKTWGFVDGFTWSGPEDCCWPVTWPQHISPKGFFRVIDQGTK